MISMYYISMLISCSLYTNIEIDLNLEVFLSPFNALALSFNKIVNYNAQLNDILFLISFFAYTILIFFAIIPKIHKDFFGDHEKLYGGAHWATEYEIAAAQLKESTGVLLGQDDKNGGYYICNNMQSILLFAPTGSGKGVGFAIPNCLLFEDSLIVHDPKGENFDLTSGYRGKVLKQEVYRWEPGNTQAITHRYNPLDWIKSEPSSMVDDAQKLTAILLPNTKQDFWVSEARNLCLGVILFLLADKSRPNTFGELVRIMRSDDVFFTLGQGLDTLGGRIHPTGYMNISAFLQKAEKERSGVISHLNSALELWANPLIDNATSTSDFNIQAIKRIPTSIYCVITPDNVIRLQKLMQVFYQQAADILSNKLPDTSVDKYSVMFLLDEFPTLGRMDIFLSGIAYFRGYRVKLFLIVQDTQQLKSIYEDSGMNSFLSNCMYRISYAANNYDTAKFVSDMLGTKTVDNESKNKGAGGGGSVSEASRSLLLPQEIITLPRDEQIIMIEAYPPIKCKKIFYYKDTMFTDKLLEKEPVPKHTLKKVDLGDEEYDDDFIDHSIVVQKDNETQEHVPGSKINIKEVFKTINAYEDFAKNHNNKKN